MLSSLLLGEELRVIRKHNWDGATNAVELKRKVASVPITKDSVICDFFYLSVNDWEFIELSILVLYTYFLACVLILNEIFLKICNIDINSVCVF